MDKVFKVFGKKKFKGEGRKLGNTPAATSVSSKGPLLASLHCLGRYSNMMCAQGVRFAGDRQSEKGAWENRQL